MDDHQYVLAAHKDTDDFHAHVIANRVGPDGHANDLWHERIVRERVGAEIAAERGWDIVAGRHNRDIVQRIERLHDLPAEPERRLSDGAYRRLHERGEPPWQDVARPYILDAVDRARDWNDLRQRLGAHGVVLKLVRRGERVQGLAFAEGFDRTAPGCAASRIDSRCAISALERRFGPFTPSHEPAPSIAHGTPWNDTVRPTILAAVDAAKLLGRSPEATGSARRSYQARSTRWSRAGSCICTGPSTRCARLWSVSHRPTLQEGCARAAVWPLPAQ